MSRMNESSPPHCPHSAAKDRRICPHLDPSEFEDYFLRFSGKGAEYAVVCESCRSVAWEELNSVCEECFRGAQGSLFGQLGTEGSPEVLIAAKERCTLEMLGELTFPHRILAGCQWHNRWMVLLADRTLHLVDPFGEHSELFATVPGPGMLDWEAPIDILASWDGRFVAITNRKGRHGLVLMEENWGTISMHLDCGDYHAKNTPFPVAFLRHGNATRIIHATAWNRLDISDPQTGQCLTPRATAWEKDEPRLPHYLDFFMGALTVSPDEKTLLVDGWVWHPVGVLGTANLEAWQSGDIYACERGLGQFGIRSCNYNWNIGKAFLDAQTVIYWGIGNDDDHMVDGAVIVDLRTRKPIRQFAGPARGSFCAAEWLIVFSPDHDTTAWDVRTGERVWLATGHRARVYNQNSRHFLAWEENRVIVSRWNADPPDQKLVPFPTVQVTQ